MDEDNPPRDRPDPGGTVTGGTGTGAGGSGTGAGGSGDGRNHGGRGDGDHRGRDHGRRRDKDDDRRRHRHHRRHHDSQIYQQSDVAAGVQNVDDRDECDRGYEDGLETGAKDARRGQTYDPQRSRHYKSGGGGLFSIGRSAASKQAYRDCFLRGYEEGFHNPNLH